MLHRGRISGMLCAVLALGAVTGCGVVEKRAAKKRTNEAARQSALDGVKARIAARPNVADVDMVYLDTLAMPGTLTVRVRLRQGSSNDFEPILDVAEGEVWRSEVRPLTTLALVASDHAMSVGKDRTIDVEEQAAALTAKHGPRPVAP